MKADFVINEAMIAIHADQYEHTPDSLKQIAYDLEEEGFLNGSVKKVEHRRPALSSMGHHYFITIKYEYGVMPDEVAEDQNTLLDKFSLASQAEDVA